MKAAVVTRYGSPDAIAIREVPKPQPGPGEVLVKVRAATVNRSDSGELSNNPLARLLYGHRPDRIFGMDFAGEVEATGPGATKFAVGDRVFGIAPFKANGAPAEYFRMPETGPIALMPDGIAFAEAVVCEGAYYANATMERLNVGRGDAMLIYGASGAIGTAAVQLAKIAGAEVTAVVDTRHLALARSLGADQVVDYTTGGLKALDRRFDIVFDAVGKMTIPQWRRLLTPKGTFATTDMGPWGQSLMCVAWSALVRNNRAVVALPKRGRIQAFLAMLRERMEAGQFRAVIDRTYPLDAIAHAYRYVRTGQKTGIVVIDVALTN